MIENWLDAISLKIRPEIQESTGLERASRRLDVGGFIGTLPFALIGVFWLIGFASDPKRYKTVHR